MSAAAVFLDKDGTLLQNLPYNVDPARIRPAPGAEQALRLLGAAPLRLFVVSNQPGVALGRFEAAALPAVGEWLSEWFRRCGAELAEFVWCPHAPDGHGAPACACRKPRPGMLRSLARRHALDLRRSWMIGDILDDIEAGNRAGCRTVLVDNGGETLWRMGRWRIADHRAADLAQAAQYLLRARAAPGMAA